MDFYQPKRQAILYGVSDAVFPQEDETGKPAVPLLAKWSKTCTLYFTGAPQVARTAHRSHRSGVGGDEHRRAELDGDVYIDHPQLKLKSHAPGAGVRHEQEGGLGGPADHAARDQDANDGADAVAQLTSKTAGLERELAAVRKSMSAIDTEIATLNEPLAGETNVQDGSQKRAADLAGAG